MIGLVRRTGLFSVVFLALGLVIISCQGISGPTSKPTVIISTPPSGSIYSVGEEVVVQSTATDSSGVTSVALVVDGNVVREDPSPVTQGQAQFSLIQSWIADGVGQHTITVRATNAQGAVSESGILITVLEPGGAVQPTAIVALATAVPIGTTQATGANPAVTVIVTATPGGKGTGPGGCSYNSKFVADVTIPDGTVVTPNAVFTKTWRVQNTGSCAWDNAALAFTGGTQMAANTSYPVPTTPPGGTADLVVPMTAPSTYGTFKGNWKLRNAVGQLFGTNLTVVINVPAPATAVPPTNTPPPTVAGCSGKPNDFTFTASNTTISAGQSVNLTWSAVTNASEVFLSGGDFGPQPGEGVETPGNRTVSPSVTTSYTLRATCGNSGQSRDKTVTVTIGTGTPTVAFDFVERAPEAQWCSAGPSEACTVIGFNGSDTDTDGFALWRTGMALENNAIPLGKALETHPKWVNDGIITGLYPEYEVEQGDHFKAKFGFLKNADAGNVKIQLNYRENGTLYPLGSWTKAYDGSLLDLDVDLAALEGKDVQFALAITANGAPGQDWATWVRPRIER